MRSMKYYWFICLGLLVLGIASPIFCQSRVSFVNLLANPEKYDGKKIIVSGVLHFQFEDSSLYMHKDDADYLILANGIWVDYARERTLSARCSKEFVASGSKLDYFDGKYVSLTGVFNMKSHGHMGAFAGTLEEVSDIFELRKWFDGPRKVAVSKDESRTFNDCKR
jgi:hypothetical protein